MSNSTIIPLKIGLKFDPPAILLIYKESLKIRSRLIPARNVDILTDIKSFCEGFKTNSKYARYFEKVPTIKLEKIIFILQDNMKGYNLKESLKRAKKYDTNNQHQNIDKKKKNNNIYDYEEADSSDKSDQSDQSESDKKKQSDDDDDDNDFHDTDDEEDKNPTPSVSTVEEVKAAAKLSSYGSKFATSLLDAVAAPSSPPPLKKTDNIQKEITTTTTTTTTKITTTASKMETYQNLLAGQLNFVKKSMYDFEDNDDDDEIEEDLPQKSDDEDDDHVNGGGIIQIEVDKSGNLSDSSF
jgi:hypothetical protein